jgi:cold shock CspA family protein/ribosome-associated translation inhibitor RaiA
MEIPFQITFRGMDESEALWRAVQERVEGLSRFYQRIVACEVVIAAPHRHRHKARIFHIHIKLRIPGKDLYVSHEPEMTEDHMNPYAAVGDAFDEIQRQLEDEINRRRWFVKQKAGPPHARIFRIFKDDGYGFLLTPEGREIYFHENSVLGAKFKDLVVGQEVRYEEEMGDKGPQVTSMHVIRRRRPVELFQSAPM